MTEQKRPLYSIFTAVPQRYDIINRIFTWGMDEKWRKRTALICLHSAPVNVMDLCCGTGDLAIWLGRLSNPGTQVYGLDYSWPMLELARQKARRYPLKAPITFINGDVTNLPFEDSFFDSIGISFAFRNLTYRNPRTQRYLSEVVRVLKPGGQFVIVESSQPPNPVIRWLFHVYVRWFVFRVGYWISGNRPAYKYLSESARNFYSAEELADLLVGAGFSMVKVKRQFLGAAAIHIAVK